ncbi:MAG: glycosyltransferase [Steroidobacteraceae bacterium]
MGFPRAVISNSRAALTERGIEPSRRFVIVPNGIDTERFRPDADARMQVRDELRVQHGERLVGCMARLDPVKDHHSMLRAMALIAARRSEVRFVVVGAGSPGYDAELKDAATELRIDTLVRWMGERADVERILNALDVYVSASTAEGFSNSLAESMACGVPPVVTDVGDSRDIVACHGTTVVPRNAQALTDGVIDWLDRDSPDLRCRRRDWIVQQFGVEQMVDRTLAVFAAALSS